MIKNPYYITFRIFAWTIFIVSILIGGVEASAANTVTGTETTVIQNILCNAAKVISGNIGKTIAVLVVVSVAIGLFVGKITWGVAIAVAVGMGVLFGAQGLVGLISGSGANVICP